MFVIARADRDSSAPASGFRKPKTAGQTAHSLPIRGDRTCGQGGPLRSRANEGKADLHSDRASPPTKGLAWLGEETRKRTRRGIAKSMQIRQAAEPCPVSDFDLEDLS